MYKQNYLKKSAISLSGKILKAEKNKSFFLKPYKHLFIDSAIDEDFANKCLKSFPKLKKNFGKNQI